MGALVAIGWAAALLAAVFWAHLALGNWGLVNMFPEGQRWWHPWHRLASLAGFALVVLANPFNRWLS